MKRTLLILAVLFLVSCGPRIKQEIAFDKDIGYEYKEYQLEDADTSNLSVIFIHKSFYKVYYDYELTTQVNTENKNIWYKIDYLNFEDIDSVSCLRYKQAEEVIERYNIINNLELGCKN